jgi:hypothetical protein
MPTYPNVNDRAYSYASIELDIDGDLYYASKSINYSDNMEPGELRGQSQHRLGRTAGDYKAEASLELSREEWEILRAKFGDGFMLRSFDIQVSYSEDNMPLITDEVVGCRIKKVDYSNSQGPDASMVKLDLDVTYIKHNGSVPFKFNPQA